MAKWNGNSIQAIELVDNPQELPWYAEKLAGQVVLEIGLHFHSSNLPWFTCAQYQLEDGHYMMFEEIHVKRFIYKKVEE